MRLFNSGAFENLQRIHGQNMLNIDSRKNTHNIWNTETRVKASHPLNYYSLQFINKTMYNLEYFYKYSLQSI